MIRRALRGIHRGQGVICREEDPIRRSEEELVREARASVRADEVIRRLEAGSAETFAIIRREILNNGYGKVCIPQHMSAL